MQLQRLLSITRKAIDEYAMIQEGDHIAVGISGGKDSLTLLYALHGLKRFYPQHFELSAVTVDLGFPGFDLEPIRELCGTTGSLLRISTRSSLMYVRNPIPALCARKCAKAL